MFFKKDENKDENIFLINTCALLIHAAKIDENYTENEEEIIKKTLLELGAAKENITETIEKAKTIEVIFWHNNTSKLVNKIEQDQAKNTKAYIIDTISIMTTNINIIYI